VTRALGIALASAATLGVIVAAFLIFLPGPRPRRPESPPVPGRREPAPRVRVLAGETAERAVVLKPRYLDAVRADFTDRALAEALGAKAGELRFVEVWVVEQSAGAPVTGQCLDPPEVVPAHGAVNFLWRLDGLEAGGAAPLGPRGRMFAAAYGPAAAPVSLPGKGTFRRSVYAMPADRSFADLVSAEHCGVHLEPLETTDAALEAFFEHPRSDMIAALTKNADGTASRARAEAGTENPR
jgi:hypothetical protein